MNCVCSKQNQWANMRKSPNIGKNRAILMPSLLKTAKSADSWRPSAERRKIQTLDQCFPRARNQPGKVDVEELGGEHRKTTKSKHPCHVLSRENELTARHEQYHMKNGEAARAQQREG